MSLKDTFYRKVVDPILCPPQIINQDGQDAYDGKGLINFIKQPEMAIPLLATASYIAIKAYSDNTPIAQIVSNAITVNYGLALGFLSLEYKKRSKKRKNKDKKPSPEYYIDRTKKQKNTVTKEILSDIKSKFSNATADMVADNSFVIFSSIFLYAAAKQLTDHDVIHSILPYASIVLSKNTSEFWKTFRSVNGHWNVEAGTPESKPDKAMVPAPIPL